jgi:anti-sigma B factor antagonist
MSFSVQEKYNAVIFEIKGKFLGSIEGPAFKEKVNEYKEAGKTQGIIDLSKADFMDSSGIGLLISALTTMRKAGGDIRLAGMQKRIKNIFLLTRLLGPVFDDYETVEEALASYQETPSS